LYQMTFQAIVQMSREVAPGEPNPSWLQIANLNHGHQCRTYWLDFGLFH
jgi:hypothetical protein